MKENKDKTNIWLDIEKSAEILGLSIQTLKSNVEEVTILLKLSDGEKELITFFF